MNARLALPLALLALIACTPKRIPGSEIEDNSDTRAIIDVLQAYQTALHKKDAPALLALVSPSYADDMGTSTPADDLDRERLERELPARLAAIQDIQVDLSVRRVDVDGKRASAVFYFDTSYRIPRINQPQRADSDLTRMDFVHENGAWKITKGL